MSLVLDTGTMKYRENPNQPWRPLVIKAGMNWESMADTYDPDNGTYEVGQYVLEEGMMYRCISEITTPEAWTPAHWTSVNVGDELSSFIIISDDQPTDETNKIWIAETTAPFGVQIPTMDDHNALVNTLNQLDGRVDSTQSTEAYVLGAATAGVSISGSGVYVIYNDALYTTTQSIASTDTAPYTGKITPVPGGGLNSLKNSIFGSIKSYSFGNAGVSQSMSFTGDGCLLLIIRRDSSLAALVGLDRWTADFTVIAGTAASSSTYSISKSASSRDFTVTNNTSRYMAVIVICGTEES